MIDWVGIRLIVAFVGLVVLLAVLFYRHVVKPDMERFAEALARLLTQSHVGRKTE